MSFLVAFLWLTAALLAGCARQGGNSVSGQVTLDGEPVHGGSIVFLPAGGEGTKGAAEIIDGKYAIPAEQALPPGSYRVEINWSKPTGKQLPSGDPGMMMEERAEVVPAKYNRESTLIIEITNAANKHDFLLTK